MQSKSSEDSNAHEVIKNFGHEVNMTANELTRWLETDESREVGQKNSGSESVGHRSGRHIVELLGKKADEFQPNDIAHMRKVLGYIKRHLAQRPDHPAKEIEHSAWRYSLMNWGHDPRKRL